MLEGLAHHSTVRAIVPVPWTERIRSKSTPPTTTYPAIPAPFNHLPVIDRLSLARRMHSGARSILAAEPRPDVILSYWADPDGTAAQMWGRQIDVPVVQMVGGSDVLLLAADPARRELIARTLQGAAMVLAIGDRVRQAALELGTPADKVHVISRGVDRSRFHHIDQHQARTALGLPLDTRLLLWVGRMVPVKGLDVLLRAFADEQVQRSGARLLLVGDGPLRGKLERLARKLGISERVTFVGPVAHADLPNWFAAADRVVLPSLSEGVPNVLLEGLACGTPFLSSNVGSVAELASQPESLLPPGEVAAWTAGLRRLGTADDASGALPEIADHTESAARLAGLLREAAGIS